MIDFTRREALLIELVWILAYGDELELGLSLAEVMKVLESRVRTRDMKTVFEVLEEEGHSFLQEIKDHIKSNQCATSSESE